MTKSHSMQGQQNWQQAPEIKMTVSWQGQQRQHANIITYENEHLQRPETFEGQSKNS